jgi:hypothetical protein
MKTGVLLAVFSFPALGFADKVHLQIGFGLSRVDQTDNGPVGTSIQDETPQVIPIDLGDQSGDSFGQWNGDIPDGDVTARAQVIVVREDPQYYVIASVGTGDGSSSTGDLTTEIILQKDMTNLNNVFVPGISFKRGNSSWYPMLVVDSVSDTDSKALGKFQLPKLRQ